MGLSSNNQRQITLKTRVKLVNYIEVTPNISAKYKCNRKKIAAFDQKWHNTVAYLLRKANRKSYVIYQMVLFPITLTISARHKFYKVI